MLLPDIETKHLHVRQRGRGQRRQVEQRLQVGLHLGQLSYLHLVAGPVAEAREEGAHRLRGPLDVGDVVAPKVGAIVAGGAGGEGGVEAPGALVAEDARHPDSAQALPGVRVTWGPVSALQVTVTRCEPQYLS